MSTLQERFARLYELKPEITKAELARLTGRSAPSVGDWFSGKIHSLKADTAAKVAAAYGVNQTWLATGEGPMTLMPEPLLDLDRAIQEGRATAVTVGKAKIQRPEFAPPPALGDEAQQHLMRLLRVLHRVPGDRQVAALRAATEVLLDHLPDPPSA